MRVLTWRRQAETAVAALKAHEQMMTQITQKFAEAVGPDIMHEFTKTWGPHLQAMQDLVATWRASHKT